MRRIQKTCYSIIPLRLAALLLCLGLLLPATAVQAEETRLVIRGSTTILPIASAIGRVFQQRYPDIRVMVEGGGSLAGLRTLIAGEAEIATSSTFISDAEIQLARERGVYPVPFRIAYDCIMPIVNGSNPLSNLSSLDLKRIYRGEIHNWRQLGGPDQPIEVLSRDTASGTYKVWNEVVMQQEAVAAGVSSMHSSAEMVKAVAENPGAIGYIGLSYLNARVKPLKVDGIMGSTRSMKNGVYPLSRPLFLFTDGWPRGLTLEYVNFVLDPDSGQAMIAAAGYIPLN